ncbi:MAG: glycosyltransferase [Candidatus Latescibacteria bacterium]|nr:glycosyltransferase [Candidatus Latescibacterota bacterium]
MIKIDNYSDIVGENVITSIYKKMRKLYGKHVLNINSTYIGGGVAEILSSLIPLMNDVGIDAGWRTVHGNVDFYGVTKKFHNALQGQAINFSQEKKNLYEQVNRRFSRYTHINDHDIVVIHDPQPLPLIQQYTKRQPWIWRCHIDLSAPNKDLWNYLKRFIIKYDMIIVSSEKYESKDLPMEYRIIPPAIDPLTDKNKQISDTIINKYLKKHDVPTDKPLITQISRFDKWKDPEGVVEVFRRVKDKCENCRLVLCGNMATDDPEGLRIFEKIMSKAKKMIDKKEIILLTVENSILVNALQRKSAVIIQKSLREGFGLTVTEGLWKERPVIASNVGGITLQIQDGENGYLLEPNDIDGYVDRTLEILKNPSLSQELGKKGKETVRKKFLITRILVDYLDLFNDISS